MFGILFRGIFLVGIMFWYSIGVWRLVDDYFRDHFKQKLEEKYKENKHLRPNNLEQLEKISKLTNLQNPDDEIAIDNLENKLLVTDENINQPPIPTLPTKSVYDPQMANDYSSKISSKYRMKGHEFVSLHNHQTNLDANLEFEKPTSDTTVKNEENCQFILKTGAENEEFKNNINCFKNILPKEEQVKLNKKEIIERVILSEENKNNILNNKFQSEGNSHEIFEYGETEINSVADVNSLQDVNGFCEQKHGNTDDTSCNNEA